MFSFDKNLSPFKNLINEITWIGLGLVCGLVLAFVVLNVLSNLIKILGGF